MTTLPVKDIKVPVEDRPAPSAGSWPPKSDAFDLLVQSIGSYGMLIPVFVTKKGVLISGHYRFWAAEKLGWDDVPVAYVESAKEVTRWFAG